MGFLNQLFKHRESGESVPVVSEPAVTPIENPFLHPKDPPARLQPPLIHAPRGLGAVVRAMSAPTSALQLPTVMFLELGDVLPRVPEQYVRPGNPDLRQLLQFDAQELATAMAKGRVEVALPQIAAQCSHVFFMSAQTAADVFVRLPLQKLVDQMGESAVRVAPQPVVVAEQPTQEEAEQTLAEAAPQHVEAPPPQVKEAPTQEEAEQTLAEAASTHVDAPPPQVEEAPTQQKAEQTLTEAAPQHVEEVPTPTEPPPPPAEQTPPPAPPPPHPASDDLVAGPLLTPVHASVDAPLQATLRPMILGATVPPPEISPAHAPASIAPAAPIRLMPIQPPQIRAVILSTAPPLPQPQAPTPAPPAPEPPCSPRSIALHALFLTDDPLTLADVAHRVAALPSVLACHISCGEETAQAGTFPDGFSATHLQALAPELTASASAAASHIRIGEVQNVTLHCEAHSLTIFTRSGIVLGAVLGPRGFVPGVRERLAQVVAALSIS